MPTQTRVIAERFFDDAGGMQLVIHAPFGGRINRAWGMALRKRFCRSFDFELQAAATDDGIVLSLGPQHSFPLETVFSMLRADDVEELLIQAALQAPMFETRWRWNAMRSLALLRSRGGKRVPPALQRMRAQDLIAAVFPGQTACQDNHGGGADRDPRPPAGARDRARLPGRGDGRRGPARRAGGDGGRPHRRRRRSERPEPSVFAHEILNANPYAFLDDAPLEERRTRAVALRRGLPAAVVERIGGLDPAAIEAVVAEAQPDPRDADELHDLLLDLGALPEAIGRERGLDRPVRGAGGSPAGRPPRGRSASTGSPPSGARVAARGLAGAPLRPRRRRAAVAPAPRLPDGESALVEIVRGHLALARTDHGGRDRRAAGRPRRPTSKPRWRRLEMEGAVLRGRFLSDVELATATQWCERRLLARINRRMLDGLRREIEPVSAADFLRFLFGWQHVRPGSQLHGQPGPGAGDRPAAGLRGRGRRLGARDPPGAPRRLRLRLARRALPLGRRRLGAAGGAARRRHAQPRGADRARAARRSSLAAGARRGAAGRRRRPVAAPPATSLAFLARAGASFLDEIIAGTRRLRAEVEDALGELVSAGRVTGDGFSGLRALISATQTRGGARARWHARWTRRTGGARSAPAAGRCCDPPGAPATAARATAPSGALAEETRHEALARQYIKRYGVVFRDLLARETQAPPWRDLVRIYRRLEMSGELRGGRFVGGFVGEQFAHADAVEALRATRREPKRGEIVRLSACDPLNLVGIITPGARVPAALPNTVVYEDGVPQLAGLSAPPSSAGEPRPWAAIAGHP